MLPDRESYWYITIPRRIAVKGDPMPGGNLRGESVAFLMEACIERHVAQGGDPADVAFVLIGMDDNTVPHGVDPRMLNEVCYRLGRMPRSFVSVTEEGAYVDKTPSDVMDLWGHPVLECRRLSFGKWSPIVADDVRKLVRDVTKLRNCTMSARLYEMALVDDSWSGNDAGRYVWPTLLHHEFEDVRGDIPYYYESEARLEGGELELRIDKESLGVPWMRWRAHVKDQLMLLVELAVTWQEEGDRPISEGEKGVTLAIATGWSLGKDGTMRVAIDACQCVDDALAALDIRIKTKHEIPGEHFAGQYIVVRFQSVVPVFTLGDHTDFEE
ncbi:MAG: hypothetical protein SPK87_01200 [Bacteroidales bacterium]|nr:hypothetical protein [Bacteroidales bacterium]